MKYLVITLILTGFLGVVLAEDSSDSPIPEPEQDVSVPKNCGSGTTYHDGICIVNDTEEKTANSNASRWGAISQIDSPLKQIKSGIKSHNVECNEGLELIYKKSDNTSACVSIFTKIELILRGWGEDNRVLLGCTPSRYEKCYPSDTIQYRKVLYDYYFEETNLPDSSSFEFARMHVINACTDQSVCFGQLENGTSIRIGCDFPLHGCSPKIFGDYSETSIVKIPKGAVVQGNEGLDPKEITVVLNQNSTVTWINEDSVAHGIASDKGGDEFWGTGIILPGNEASIQFNNTGIFEYHGQPHPWITGRVIVIDGEDSVPRSLEEN